MKPKKKRRCVERLEARDLLAADVGLDEALLPPPRMESGPPALVGQEAPSGRDAPPRLGDHQRRTRPGLPRRPEGQAPEPRSIDGTENNLESPTWGSVDTQLLRITSVEYADGISEPAGDDRPSAREISNAVVAQTTTETNDRFLTDITWLWGQFIDHDIDLTGSGDPAEFYNIQVPEGDLYFDPDSSGDNVIQLARSLYDSDTGTSAENPRQQINQITAFLDGSVIYGSDLERAAELRTFAGGLLKTSSGDLLPFNEAGLENAGGTSDTLFLAGDVRANENAALTAMHTLWVREHNYWAAEIAARDPALSDEQLYQAAKAMVTAELQAITYNEFLPALLGNVAMSSYAGYDATVDPTISNVFSTAAYRFGHSMLSSTLLRLDGDGTPADEGNLALQDAFFAPGQISDHGIDSLLLGATAQIANEIDTQIVDDVRNFLFGAPGSGGFDLASLNIQRGRDHGLADYNQVREDLGLDRVTSLDQITSDPLLAAQLEELYGDVDNIDVWVGGLAEDHLPDSSVGELISTVLVDQFERIRAGDRYWYENVFSGGLLARIDGTSLSDVIQRNTDISGLRENVFFDESVMRFEFADRGTADVVLAMDESQIELVDARSGEVLESRAINDISQVQIVGSNRLGERITIDLGARPASVPGGIVVSGGLVMGSTVDLFGSDGDDTVVVNGNQVIVNGLVVQLDEIERLKLDMGPGDNIVEILDEGEMDVTVVGQDDAPGGRRGRRSGRGRR